MVPRGAASMRIWLGTLAIAVFHLNGARTRDVVCVEAPWGQKEVPGLFS